jgi:hypothetical protein
VLTTEFGSMLRDLVIAPPIPEWFGDAVLESDRTEQAAHEQSIKRCANHSFDSSNPKAAVYTPTTDGAVINVGTLQQKG